MPIGTPQGTLDFKSVDKVTFVGASSNTVIDTTTGSLGVGVDVNGPTSNLHVVGHTRLEGDINMLHTANTASIKLDSNVVTEFTRSKKLIKYPRVALTSASYNAYESGYKVTVSGFVNTSNHPWKVFNGIDFEVGMLLSGLNYDTNGNANTSGTTASRLSASDSTPYGEWLKLELPNKIKLDRYAFTSRNHATHWSQSVESGQVWGSNNDSDWEHLHTFTNSGFTGGSQTASFDVQTDNYYKYYAFIVTKTFAAGSDYYLCLPELKYFGVPEYDPEAHGTDVMVKSVPNVPNTDWLEVYYDAKGLGNGSTTVNDLKPVGTANNGTVGGNTSVTDEAFTFDGTGDYITSTVTTGTGNQSFSVACWFKFTTLGGLLWGFTGTTNGTSGSNPTNNSTPHAYFNTTGSISFDFWANSTVTAEKLIEVNRWYAGVWTYDGITRKIYIDGTQVDLPQSSTPLSIIDNTSRLSIGIYPTNLSGGPMTGSVANFRLFNRVLTSDEAWQLYAYQKEYFGYGDLSMTLKAGRLGIGTSEPRAVLDVRGDVAGRFTRFLTYDHVVHSSTTFNSGPSWPIGQSLSLVSHTWDIPTEYAALGKGTLNGYAYVSWSGSCPNPWQAVFWIDIYYNGVYMGRGSTNSDVGNTSAMHGNTTVALTHHDEDNGSTLDSANVTTGFRLPDCNLSRGSTIKIDLICQRGDYQSGENVVWTNRNHTAPSSNARDYEQGTTNFFVLLNVE